MADKSDMYRYDHKERGALDKVGVLHPVQQSRSYWDRPSALSLAGLELTQRCNITLSKEIWVSNMDSTTELCYFC